MIAVHRIDRDTSGLVAFARTAEAESHLGQQFRAHTVSRRYLAIVRGHPSDYNSDPELVYNPETNRLLLFYRFVDKKTNTILISSSSDGRKWKPEPQ